MRRMEAGSLSGIHIFGAYISSGTSAQRLLDVFVENTPDKTNNKKNK
jgi:hypothetical protein